MATHTPARKSPTSLHFKGGDAASAAQSRGASVRKVSPFGTSRRRRPKTGLTARIRRHISKINGPFSACVVARELGVPIIRFYCVLRMMRLRGEITKVPSKPGWYVHHPVDLCRKPSEARPRLYKAMHIKIRFSVQELAMLADTYPKLARYQVNRLRATGEIERIGRQMNPNGKWESIYRVKNRDEFFLKYVKPRIDEKVSAGSHRP
jgi:hypothetical protein